MDLKMKEEWGNVRRYHILDGRRFRKPQEFVSGQKFFSRICETAHLKPHPSPTRQSSA
jgi:hypothetical protein